MVIATRRTGTTMTSCDYRLLSLLSWFSPVFPTGGFAYSAGLESAIAGRTGFDETMLLDWLENALRHGNPRNDAILIAETSRCCDSRERVGELTQICLALAGSQERHGEIARQGRSFMVAVRHWLDNDAELEDLPLPVAVGYAIGKRRLSCESAIASYLHAFVSAQLQCAIRLSVLGQEGAARILAVLEPTIGSLARDYAPLAIDDLGSCAFAAEIAAMNHETLQPRLFLS